MIVVLKPNQTPEKIQEVREHVVELGYDPRIIQGVERTIIAGVGDELSHRSLEFLQGMDAVENVIPVQKRYKLTSRQFHPADRVVRIGRHPVGAGNFQIIAGPCAVESRDQIRTVAKDISSPGVRILRGGAFKPRTSPYDFQGLQEKGLELLNEAKHDFGLAIATEVVATNHVQAVAEVADILQIGARNCQNYNLLETVAAAGKPVLLKRGMAATIEEWLSAAEYLVVNGCEDVVLCERGIRTFEHATRATLDISAVVIARQETHLPVIVDPSHAAGRSNLVLPLAMAAVAAGADGLLVETHPDPVEALSDAAQQLPSGDFSQFVEALRPLVTLMGRTLCP